MVIRDITTLTCEVEVTGEDQRGRGKKTWKDEVFHCLGSTWVRVKQADFAVVEPSLAMLTPKPDRGGNISASGTLEVLGASGTASVRPSRRFTKGFTRSRGIQFKCFMLSMKYLS